jgi:uncharacterized protein (TIGR02996 family)
MTNESDFQDLIDRNPKCHVLKEMFADWLQERGDPRAEGYRALIRGDLARLRNNKDGVLRFEGRSPGWVGWSQVERARGYIIDADEILWRDPGFMGVWCPSGLVRLRGIRHKPVYWCDREPHWGVEVHSVARDCKLLGRRDVQDRVARAFARIVAGEPGRSMD